MKTLNRARRELKAAFALKGETLKAFADMNGFEYQTVKRTIQRHWGKKTRPRGKITVKILEALKRYSHDVSSENKIDEEIIHERASSF